MTTRLFRTIARTVAKAVPAAGAAYDLLLQQEVSGTATVDGTFSEGAATIDISGIPAGFGPGLLIGDKLKVGADPTTYTVVAPAAVATGRAAGVALSPPLSYQANDGGAVDIARSASHFCKGLETAFAAYSIAQSDVCATDVKVLILAGTLPAGVSPQPGDRITTPNRIVTIVPAGTPGRPAVVTDPAGATHECRCA
ncbi:hypothetical protein TSA6c_16915 [Azospirillum sp. TSA6c]|uniref:hypothetical protein n=1 Tax=Azospirillum sp. TSA6c TaxID=709813 RepID=UPI000D61FBCA|nr:hypothetical protein [Azospirillum sp. TSA6c]PWC48118.1 hypothetical protein TSA6c_16915 [Azospirillum sp. TSA6c]